MTENIEKKKRLHHTWKGPEAGHPRGPRSGTPKFSKMKSLQNLTRIPFQMARKGHFEAPEGMDRFWAPGPRL